MSEFLVESLQSLEAYTPGHQPKDKVMMKLNTNENPYPPPPEVGDIVAKTTETLHLYNDPTCRDLVDAFAENYGISKESVIFSNGSDEILAFIFLAFCDKKQGVCFPEITYGFYEVFAQLFGVPFEKIPLNEDFTINISEYYEKKKTILIANPNAPTSLALSLKEITSIVEKNPKNVVIIDEAYVDFGGKSAIHLTETYRNLLVTGTFSKSRNLAGARLGFAVGNKELISDLNRIKYSFNPYNVNGMTQAIGVASLKNHQYFSECCDKVLKSRKYLVDELEKLGFLVLDSKANFIFTKHEKIVGEKLLNDLNERNILVRHFKQEKIKDFVRITIGTQENMETLVKNLKEMVEDAHATS